jgi:hypothetical protein
VTSSVEANSVASWFHASSAAKALSGCKLSPGNAEKLLTAAVAEDSSVADIYYAYFALKNLGLAGNVIYVQIMTFLSGLLTENSNSFINEYMLVCA